MNQVLLTFSLSELVILFVVFAVSAAVQGAVGYGMALIAAPIATLIEPELIPGPLTLAALVLIFLVAARDKQALDFRGLRWALAGMVPGTIIGSLILTRLPTKGLVTVFAFLVLVAVGLSIAGLKVKPHPPSLLVSGWFSGLMGVLATLSGPPIALVYQNTSGPRLRATMSAYFIAASAVSLSSQVAVGELGLYDLKLALVLVPGILAGFFVSASIVDFVDRGYTRLAIMTLSTAAALMILVRRLIV
jgi:hypothetical protein